MSEEEIELHRRVDAGDLPSLWALAEIARLVEKSNDAARENWELREKLVKVCPQLNSLSVVDPVVVVT